MKVNLSNEMPVIQYGPEMGEYRIDSETVDIIRAYESEEQLRRLGISAIVYTDDSKKIFNEQVHNGLDISALAQQKSSLIIKGVIFDRGTIAGVLNRRKHWLFGEIFDKDNYEWRTDLTYPGGQAPIFCFGVVAGMFFRLHRRIVI